ncbi:MAG: glutaminyl-peptide cyclotransferase, partial [Verrucomicrobiia bacterium]
MTARTPHFGSRVGKSAGWKPSWLVVLFALASCSEAKIEVIDRPPAPKAPTLRWELVKVYPHDTEAFTQGLLYHDGRLLESTGLYGQSTLRHVELATGKPTKILPLAPHFFGEGLAELNGVLYQLTWRENLVLRWDLKTFEPLQPLRSPWEGWGLIV